MFTKALLVQKAEQVLLHLPHCHRHPRWQAREWLMYERLLPLLTSVAHDHSGADHLSAHGLQE